jgi:DNA-binding HxlR family transcriptional regulator
MRSYEKYSQPRDPLQEECAVRAALDVIRGRWKPSLLYEIKDGPRRFSELQAALPGISAQALTMQLRQLEADGVIARTVHDESPVRVEYSMTEFGATLSQVMDLLAAWGTAYLERRKLQEGGGG